MENKSKTSTTKNTPWQVKGVSPETREAVKYAARKSGKSIGQWVNDTLHCVATEELTAVSSQLPAQRLEDQLDEINKRLNDLQRPFWARLFSKRP